MRPIWSDIALVLKLPKKVDYGLIALMHLARHGEASSWSAREIAETYDIPAGLLAKILQRMARKGLVVSYYGTKGGYSLGRPADQIRALEVVEAIEGRVSLAHCFASEALCVQFKKCNLKSPLQRLNDIVVEMLSQVSLAHLVSDERKDEAARSPEGVAGGAEKLTPLPVIG